MKHSIVSVMGTALMLVATAGSAHAQSTRNAGAAIQQGFGATVAVSGGRIVVGEPANQTTPGYVHTYARDDAGEWTRANRTESPDAANGDEFGHALAVEGDLMVVTSTVEGDGVAYVFGRDGDRWSMRQDIRAPEGPSEEFGAAVALAGEHLLVGDWAADDTTGAVYAYRRAADGSFAPAGRLSPSDTTAGRMRFGFRLAVAGDLALVSAPWAEDQTGAAYVFRHDGSAWTEETVLASRSVENGDRFGSSVLIHNGMALVGTERVNRFVGAVYVFARDEDGEWDEEYALQPFDAVQQTRFGLRMKAVDDELWVGAIGANRFAGTIYRFEAGGDGGWVAASKLASDDLEASDVFGAAFDAEGDIAAIAAPNSDFGLGSVHVFRRSASGEWASQTELYTAADAMDAVVGGQVRCAGGAAAGFECGGVDLVSFVPVRSLGGGRGVRLNDIWGWTDPETGREWALVGRMDGTSFVDVTDPENPVVAANLPKTEGSSAATWRDIKVYEDYAFIVADGAGRHGVQVFDLTRLRDLGSASGPVTVEETALYSNVASVHNIVINEQTGFAYAVGSGQGGETCGGGLHMIDIRNPEQPTFAGCFADPSTGRQKTGYSHDAQCVVYEGPDQDYQGREICLGANETALSIADVTDKDDPVAISTATYPNVGYSHQGWFDEEQRYFYMNDELDEMQSLVERTRTLVWDLSDLDDPVLVKEHLGTQPSIDHNLYVKGDLMYQSNYMSGLRILDISDRTNPVEVAYFDTVPYGDNSPSFGGSWSNYPYFESGTIVVTSGSEGLFVLRKQEGRPVS